MSRGRRHRARRAARGARPDDATLPPTASIGRRDCGSIGSSRSAGPGPSSPARSPAVRSLPATSCGSPRVRLVHVRRLESLKQWSSGFGGGPRRGESTGVRNPEVHRGNALVAPGRWADVTTVDVRLINADARLASQLVLHIGSAAVAVRLRRLGPEAARLDLWAPRCHCGSGTGRYCVIPAISTSPPEPSSWTSRRPPCVVAERRAGLRRNWRRCRNSPSRARRWFDGEPSDGMLSLSPECSPRRLLPRGIEAGGWLIGLATMAGLAACAGHGGPGVGE